MSDKPKYQPGDLVSHVHKGILKVVDINPEKVRYGGKDFFFYYKLDNSPTATSPQNVLTFFEFENKLNPLSKDQIQFHKELIDRARIRLKQKLLDIRPKKQQLTVLSFGGGQDSTAILYEIIYNPQFKQRYVKGDLLVIFADTGNEHEETYAHVAKVMKLCRDNDIDFQFLTPKEWASESWSGGIISKFETLKSLPMLKGPKSCTVSLKLHPIYKFINRYIYQNYNTEKESQMSAIKEFAEKNGKIRMIIGIAKGEEKRITDPAKAEQKYISEGFIYEYPLIDMGIDRAAAQKIIKQYGHEVPIPSNCMICPYMNKAELLWLYKFKRYMYDKAVEMEKNKIEFHQKVNDLAEKGDWETLSTMVGPVKIANLKEKIPANDGMFGEKLIPQMLKEAQQEFGHLSDAELFEQKMSHGHCRTHKY